ncbi:MAG: excisionase family DNA-binding protein [bacterium]|nr:excisionase family DNA-binding protein [bacterium]MDE0353386.1 excisionase family DNA-binding protein [bacterium]
MTLATEAYDTPRAPNRTEAKQAGHAAELLQAYLAGHSDAAASLQVYAADQPSDPQVIALPAPAVSLLREVLAELAKGRVVTVAAPHSELTTQQAADLLNVSRPYLVSLLEKRAIPFRRVGNRRRVRLADVLAYRRHEELERQRILDELTAEAEHLGLEY